MSLQIIKNPVGTNELKDAIRIGLSNDIKIDMQGHSMTKELVEDSITLSAGGTAGSNFLHQESSLARAIKSKRKVSTRSYFDEPRCYYTIKSKYEDVPATVIFNIDGNIKELEKRMKTKVEKHEIRDKKEWKVRGMYFRFSKKVIKFNCIRGAFLKAGIRETSSKATANFMWGLSMKKSQYAKLNKFQKFNHFPGSFNLGRKDTLHRNLSMKRRIHGPKEYNFFPRSFILPQDKDTLKKEMELDEKKIFIMKPKSSSCGKGIKLVRKYSDIKRKACIVQEYINRPMTIEGRKFDLRLYVCVTSFDPLRIYLFDEGLCRISTGQYSLKKNSRYIHLTNYSVNKKSKQFIRNNDSSNNRIGNKWSISGLKEYFKEKGINDDVIWSDIKDVICKTILSVEGKITALMKKYLTTKSNVCFELLGFDILIDECHKPWILEVNIGPSLSSSSPMDKKIKTRLVATIFQMIGVVPYDRKEFESKLEQEKKTKSFMEPKNKKKSYRRSLSELMKLGKLDFLTKEDRSIILETELEYARRGGFERIFPTKKSEEKYAHLFSSQRYTNLLLYLWLQESESRKNHLLKTSSPKYRENLKVNVSKPKPRVRTVSTTKLRKHKSPSTRRVNSKYFSYQKDERYQKRRDDNLRVRRSHSVPGNMQLSIPNASFGEFSNPFVHSMEMQATSSHDDQDD